MMKPMFVFKFAAVTAAAALLACGGASAADLVAAKKKVQEVCAACHGLDGISTVPDFPKLAGQYPDYMAKALRDYRSGVRKNAVMAGFATQLTDKDIENLSAYYAAQPSVLSSRY